MPDKKAELDILGETHIPSDLLTPTLGSNYGLDGPPDMEYGMGVLDGVLSPEHMEAPALPTGLTKSGAEEGMDLTAYLGEDSLADLEWLDPTQLPDPERLPERPVNIPELEEAWGVDRRTDGMHVYAQDLGHAKYVESLEKGSKSKRASRRSMEKVIRRAMQRSAIGQDLDAILSEARVHLGAEADRMANALNLVADEHGLAGNVFIRAAAYPGYSEGKWKTLRKLGAQYVIVTPEQMKQATWIQDGRCTYTGKQAVTEVPWKEARRHYAQLLLASKGVRLASGDAREALKQAFLALPEAKKADSGFLPTHDPTVREGFLAEPAAEQKVYDKQAARVRKGVAKVARAILKGHTGDVLKILIQKTFRDEDRKLAAQKLYPILKATGALGKQEEARTYEGAKFRQHTASKADGHVLGGVSRGALSWIRRAMSEGFAGADLDQLIQNRFANSVLEDIDGPLAKLRKAHEGGAGFLYVDAAAYATSSGVSGCESGALKHRANQVPAVASMSRCATCTRSRTLEDGTKKCAVYNKALLDDTTGPDIERVKKANIKVANMNDAEQTAAMFASPDNAFDPAEYGLRNATLDEVESFPEGEKMANITFGGWDI
jgi:hypothetical protein